MEQAADPSLLLLLLLFLLPLQQQYPIDNKVLVAIEVVVMAILEGKRYEGYKKTGEVRGRPAAAMCNWAAVG